MGSNRVKMMKLLSEAWEDDVLTAKKDAAPIPPMKDMASENKELRDQIRRLKQYVSELEHSADMDPLVPVYNRRAFMRELARAQSVLDRYNIPCSIIFFDLDGFKAINDRYGHALGDQVLRDVGNALTTHVRDCDMVARLGGDEFGVLLFRTQKGIAEAKAASLACRIAEIRIEMPTGHVSVDASWGIATCDSSQTAEQILSRADRHMYMSKKRAD